MGALNNSMWNVSTAAGGVLDAGIYSDGSDGRGAWATTNTMNKRATVSYWYRNDYANSSYGTQFWGHFHGSQDHSGGWLGADGYIYHFVKYNNSSYHNGKSSSACSANQVAHNKWHHFCLISGTSTVKVYIDGTEMLSLTASDYTDVYSKYWGLHSTWNSYIGSLTGGPSWTAKSPTYMAQHTVVTGATPGIIGEFINTDDGTIIDFLDIDGSGTDLDTIRAGPENSSELNGIWLFGANGTTADTGTNSATDGSSNANWNVDANWALSTDTNIFPVTGIDY